MEIQFAEIKPKRLLHLFPLKLKERKWNHKIKTLTEVKLKFLQSVTAT